jgi:hypothetical protein
MYIYIYVHDEFVPNPSNTLKIISVDTETNEFLLGNSPALSPGLRDSPLAKE